MKVLILDLETKLFAGANGSWTAGPEEANDFSFTTLARSVADRLGLKRYQVLFYFEDIKYSIVVSDTSEDAAAVKA
jgi:hypothetical protein